MQVKKIIHVVSCHAEGEVGDVIVGGVMPPPGETLWQQSRYIAKDGRLRNFLLNEPRGGVFRHVNLLVPAKHPKAQMGFIIMEPEDTPPMSGSNSICVATVLLDSGIIAMTEPETRLILEAPGGLIEVVARCENGKAKSISILNVTSFADRLQVPLQVEGLGEIIVDTAYGGDSFVIVSADDLGLEIRPENAGKLAQTGVRITAAANQQLGFCHPENPDWTHISFCQFTTALERDANSLSGVNAVAVRPGKIDRSPTGTGVCARMAVLEAKGEMSCKDIYNARSILGSTFTGSIEKEIILDGRKAIVPRISGRAWITGTHQHMLVPGDPWPQGYRLSDTWPVL